MSGLELLAIAGIAGAGAQMAGSLVSAAGQRQAGEAAMEDAQFEATQLEQQGREEFAASQRDALERRREGVLANSRAQAVAAASGGGAGVDAPTIVRLMSGISQRAEYGAQSALYGGEQRRAGAYTQAGATRRTGRSQQRGYNMSAAGTIFSGLGSGFSSIAGYDW